jgi:hypothetical protein
MTDGAVAGNKPGVLPVAYNARQLSMILETLARLQMRKAEKINDVFHKGFSSAWGVSCARFAYKPDPVSILINTRFEKRKIPSVSFYYEMDASGRPLSTSAIQQVVHMKNIRLTNEGG